MIKKDVPMLFVYFLIRINDKYDTRVITKKALKGVILRIICGRGGLPRFMIKNVIEDMVKLGIVEKISNGYYKINEHKDERKLRLLMSYCN